MRLFNFKRFFDGECELVRNESRVFDPKDLKSVSFLGKGEDRLDGYRWVRRAKKSKRILLGLEMYSFLWRNPSKIPEEWKELGIIRFDGVLLRSTRHGGLFVLCLEWSRGVWEWDVYIMDNDCRKDVFSATV